MKLFKLIIPVGQERKLPTSTPGQEITIEGCLAVVLAPDADAARARLATYARENGHVDWSSAATVIELPLDVESVAAFVMV
jgi:hypothetical protein